MSAVGSCADNAATESFFRGAQTRARQPPAVPDEVQARPDIFDYIEHRHNLRQRQNCQFNSRGEQLAQLPVEWGEPLYAAARTGRNILKHRPAAVGDIVRSCGTREKRRRTFLGKQ